MEQARMSDGLAHGDYAVPMSARESCQPNFPQGLQKQRFGSLSKMSV